MITLYNLFDNMSRFIISYKGIFNLILSDIMNYFSIKQNFYIKSNNYLRKVAMVNKPYTINVKNKRLALNLNFFKKKNVSKYF